MKVLFFKIEILPNTSKVFKSNKKSNEKSTHILKDIKEADTPSKSIVDKLNSIRDILSILFESFHKHLHVKLTKINIRVASSDAAKTAILYGTVSSAVECIIDIIDNIANLKPIKQSSVSVEPNFLSEKTETKLNIVLYMSIGGAIKVLLQAFIKYYSQNNQSQMNNRKEKWNGKRKQIWHNV